jgi:LCP family protein required for cell wall assembly
MRAARAGRIEEARASFRAVLCEDPANETALVWLGCLAENAHEGLAYASRAVEAHLQSPRAQAALRRAWQRLATEGSANVVRQRKVPSPPARPRRRVRVRWAAAGGAACGALLLIGALVTVGIGRPVQAEAPAQAAPLASPAAALPAATESAVPASVPSSLSQPTRTPTPPGESAIVPEPATASSPPPTTLIVPAPFPSPELTSTQEVSSGLPIPEPVQPVPVAADAINIVVLGSDQRPDWSEWHTDAIHVVSVQTDRAAVTVISIPRDLYVYIPGLWMSRVNFADYYGEAYAYPGGGSGLLRDTLLYNLGIRADYFVRTDFDGLIGIVDTLGGIEVPVHCHLSDHWPYPDENGEYPVLTMEPGVHPMDGETALWYARSRLTTSVFSRERRQQEVLQAIWRKVRDVGMLTQVPALWGHFRDMVVTDMQLADILKLARVALQVENQDVRFYSIGRDAVIPWTTPRGGYVYLPRWETLQPMLKEAMAPVPEARLARAYVPVEVWNGTSNVGYDLLAADRLNRAGFPVLIGEPDRMEYAETQLFVFSEHAKGTGVEYLQRMFGVPDERVSYEPAADANAGFRLILGTDYQTCYQP